MELCKSSTKKQLLQASNKFCGFLSHPLQFFNMVFRKWAQAVCNISVLFSRDLVQVAFMSLLFIHPTIRLTFFHEIKTEAHWVICSPCHLYPFRITPEEKHCPTFLFCCILRFELAVLHTGHRIQMDSGHSFNRPASLLLTSSFNRLFAIPRFVPLKYFCNYATLQSTSRTRHLAISSCSDVLWLMSLAKCYIWVFQSNKLDSIQKLTYS